jgi:hypothetical protein
MKPIKNKRCSHCKKLFGPDLHNASRQEYCDKPECRKASKAASQKRWTEKPDNWDYFCGPTNVQRVQQWRKEHPGYWRRKSEKAPSALQETLNQQTAENNMDKTEQPSDALHNFAIATGQFCCYRKNRPPQQHHQQQKNIVYVFLFLIFIIAFYVLLRV